jgi:beta-fructofuranosidase
MNDPNGLIDIGGTHHLFFQHNPTSTVFGNIHWGHATSEDFISWREWEPALSPGDAGPYDAGGCWSGCAVVDANGRVFVVYSGHTVDGELPCIAIADDESLRHWSKSTLNPVIRSRPAIEGIENFRDHSVAWTGQLWEQWIAVGGEQGGMIVRYSSADLETWTYEGIFLGARAHNLPDGTWECPDVFELPDGTVVVLVSLFRDDAEQCLWLVGRRGVDGSFEPERYGLIDGGQFFYAPQSYWTSDRRRVMFGFLRMQRDPAALGQRNLGAQSLPRQLEVVDGCVVQTPVAELDRLRGIEESVDLIGAAVSVAVVSSALEISITGDDYELELADENGQSIALSATLFHVPHHFERAGDGWNPTSLPLTSVKIFFDHGIVEAFPDDGPAVTVSHSAVSVVTRVSLSRTSDSTVPIRMSVVLLANPY